MPAGALAICRHRPRICGSVFPSPAPVRQLLGLRGREAHYVNLTGDRRSKLGRRSAPIKLHVARRARAQPTISHHMRVMTEAGLVQAEKVGTWVCYCREDAAPCADWRAKCARNRTKARQPPVLRIVRRRICFLPSAGTANPSLRSE